MDKIFFYDSLTIDQPAIAENKVGSMEMLNKQNNTKLKIIVDATHSGVLTNHRVYPGKKVQLGYKSFFSKDKGGTSEYDLPVLTHHDQKSDPVGRIISAKFTALKSGKEFDYDYMSPDSTGKGSGVVTVEAIITDPEAIKKIIDSRYLTVSAGHSTDKVFCSVCGNDLFDRDACEHLPGKSYELEDGSSTQCFGITNSNTYHELSFVNQPAQPTAKILNHLWTDCLTSGSKEEVLLSYAMAKKEIVRELVLSDESTEYSLLTGKNKLKVKKTIVVVAPSSVDKLKQLIASSEAVPPVPIESSRHSDSDTDKNSDSDEKLKPVVTNDQNIDDSRSLQSDKGNSEAVDNKSEVKTQDVPIGDSIMENKGTELSADALKATIESLTKDLGSVKTELTAKSEEIAKQKSILDAKDSEIKRLAEDQTKLAAGMSKVLARSLAQARVMLKKPDTKDVTSKVAFDKYVDELAKRSVDSLQDSITDLSLDLAVEDKEKNDIVPPTSKLADLKDKERVSSPIRNSDPVVVKENKDLIDEIFK